MRERGIKSVLSSVLVIVAVRQAQMLIRSSGSHPSPWGALDEPELNEIRLVHVFERITVLGKRSSQGVQTYRTPRKAVDNGLEQFDVSLIQSCRMSSVLRVTFLEPTKSL